MQVSFFSMHIRKVVSEKLCICDRAIVSQHTRSNVMKPVFQTKKHNPPESYGNCYAACYASLLELDIEDVPPFELLPGFSKDDDTSDVWQRVLFSWLKAKGLRISVHRHEDGLIPVGYAMMGGKSPRGDWGHMCVVLDGKIVHDPAVTLHRLWSDGTTSN